MTAPDVDPFAEPPGPERDGKGRPLIIPIKRGKPDLKAKPIAYTRASTFAKSFSTDGGGHLARWLTRHAALGVALRPDLARMAAALGSNLNDFTPAQKADLDAIIERAHDASGGNNKADYGTAVHSLTEPGSNGVAISEGMARDVASYDAKLAAYGITSNASELFIVNDELQVAGTFDDRYLFERDLTIGNGDDCITIEAGSKLIGDKKTGSLHFDEHAIQLAIYARGKAYDAETGERISLDVSPQWGVLAHVANGKATTDLYLVDLRVGWEAAKLAKQIREFTSAKTRKHHAFPAVEVPPVAEPDGFGTPDMFAPGGANGPVEVVVTPDDGPVIPHEKLAEIQDKVNEAVAKMAEVTATPPMVEPAPEVDEAQAIANIEAAFGPTADVVLDAIGKATSHEACKALWKEHLASWTETHTEAVKARLAELGELT